MQPIDCSSPSRARRLGTVAAGAALVTGVALVAVPVPATAAEQPVTDRVSVTTGGLHPGSGGNGGSRHTERRLVSDDGRFVVFEGSAPFVKGQSALQWQIVLRDRKLGTTRVVSRNAAGALANDRSANPAISANGRWITYDSAASNLVPGDDNDARDVFRHDTRTGRTTMVTAGGSRGSGPASLSANGRYVSFLSYAGGLAPGDRDDSSQAYVHDTVTGETELVSVGTDGLGRSAMTSTSVSSDGQRILFESLDAHVAPGSHNLDVNVFLRDRATGTTRMVAGNEDGAGRSTISADGRFVAYESSDSNIVPGDTNGMRDIFVVDLDTHEHTLVSKASDGTLGDKGSNYPGLSRDGRFVVFESAATNLVPGDTNATTDVFRHDLVTGSTIRMSVRRNGAQEPYGSRSPSISGDGQHVVFESHARELTRHATGTWGQTYVRDLSGRWPAMVAKVGKLPKRVKRDKTVKIKTSGIGQGQRLVVVWKPKARTGGKKLVRTVPVRQHRLTTKAGPRRGTYVVIVRYEGREMRKQVVRTR